MRTHCFAISSRTQAGTQEITEAVFDELVDMRDQWDLFIALKGDNVWARGGQMNEKQRQSAVGHRLARTHAIPIINLARARRWLTPSQAARMTSPTAIPAPIEDGDTDRRHRKALEKGRRAVDQKTDTSTRPALWRVIQTGEKQPNGECLYRFRYDARRADGELLNYCVLWCETIPDAIRFHPYGAAARNLPICDGGYGIYQQSFRALKVTVRDCVINGGTDELVFLFDLRNEHPDHEIIIADASAALAGVDGATESTKKGARIRATRADVTRLRATIKGQPIGRLQPGAAAHFCCAAFGLHDVWSQIDVGIFDTASLVLRSGAKERAVVTVPFRVHGTAAAGHLKRVAAGWQLAPGYRRAAQARLQKVIQAALRATAKPEKDGG